jgi:hypothetical protein
MDSALGNPPAPMFPGDVIEVLAVFVSSGVADCRVRTLRPAWEEPLTFWKHPQKVRSLRLRDSQ